MAGPRPDRPVPRTGSSTKAIATDEEFAAIDAEVEQVVDEAAEFADESPEPDPDTLYDYVYSNP